jgi:cell division protein ZapE
MQVNDIADAMIIGRLLGRTMDLGVVYCMTSNYRPDELYRDGLQRGSFLPTIALLEGRLDVLHVDGGIDYRQRTLEGVEVYHTPLGPGSERALMEAFRRIAEVEEEFHELDVEGRVIPYRHRAGGVVWFDFKTICGWGRSQHDYLDLSRRFHTVIVSGVPRMGLALAEEARRFTLLVDVFYDQRVKLVVSAETAPGKLLRLEEAPADPRLRAMVFEFDRTASRLVEMQSREYLSAQRRAPA